VAEHARLGVLIDGGCGQVHQQHAEGNTVGITTPGSNDIGDDPDTGTINKPTAGCGARGHRIGCDEKGTEHAGATEQVK